MASSTRDYRPGSLVRARGRDWVVAPSDDDALVRLRPVDDVDEDSAGLYLRLKANAIQPSEYAPPDPRSASDFAGASKGEATPGPKPPEVRSSEEEHRKLDNITRSQKTAQQIAFRARIILLLAPGHSAPQVARQLGTTCKTARLWRRHWFHHAEVSVVERLQGVERPGARATFTVEQWCQIIALGCKPPELSGRPITH